MVRSKLSNQEAWAQATDDVRARGLEVGPLDDGATRRDVPDDDAGFWDAVERRAVELGGQPAGPAAGGA